MDRCHRCSYLSNLSALVSFLATSRFFLMVISRSEKLWKVIGKEGFAVRAPWPQCQMEDKLLSRQGALLRRMLKLFRGKVGKEKKGWTKGTILITNDYVEWKVNVLKWMLTQYTPGENFQATFMKDLKNWASQNVSDKKMVKFVMQFASFRKNEVEDVGDAALDIQLPFDQKSIFVESLNYLKVQLGIADLDVMDLSEAADVPAKIAETVEPGSPGLWLR